MPAWHFRATNETSVVLPTPGTQSPKASGSVITGKSHLRTGAAHPSPPLITGSIQLNE